MRGHVRRKANRWQAMYDLGPDPATGKRRQRTRMFDSAEDAENWLAGQIDRVKNLGLVGDPKRAIIRDYVTRWLDSLPRSTPEEKNTADWYRTFGRHVIDGLGAIRLRDLVADPLALETWKNSIPNPGRRYNAWRVLSRALKDAVRLGLLPSNPCERVRSPRQPDDPPRDVWAPSELADFLTASVVRKDERYPLWYTISATGMRRSEALALGWRDVDLENGTLTIRAAYKRRSGEGAYRGRVKAGNERTIDLSPADVGVLKTWRTGQRRWKLRAGPLWEESGLVFTNQIGRPWEPTSTTARFNLLAKRAGLPPLPRGLHGLRHVHASHLLAAGFDLATVAARLGHRPETLARAYAHVIRGRSKAAAGFVGDLVAGTRSLPLRGRHRGVIVSMHEGRSELRRAQWTGLLIRRRACVPLGAAPLFPTLI